MKLSIAIAIAFCFGQGVAVFLEPVIRDTFKAARRSRAWGTYAVLLLLAVGLTPIIGAFSMLQELVNRVRQHV